MSEAAYAAVDWGTSSFRLWLVDRAGDTLAERRSHEGMMAAAKPGFATVLQSHLQAVGAGARLPVVVCGMAGARGGWVEAGYVDTPARLASIVQARRRSARTGPRHPHPAGNRAAGPQGAGCHAGRRNAVARCAWGRTPPTMRSSACRAPTRSGSGSSHATVERFTTFMTGELFDVVSRETILSHAVTGADQAEDIDAFRRRSLPRSGRLRWPPTSCFRCGRASSFTAARHPQPAKKYREP